MRRFLFIALFAAATAQAGPSVDRDVVENLPAEVLTQAAPLDAQIDQLQSAIEAKSTALDREEGNSQALKFEVKAAKAQVKADKAALKAARKRDDSSVSSVAREATVRSSTRSVPTQASRVVSTTRSSAKHGPKPSSSSRRLAQTSAKPKFASLGPVVRLSPNG
jgi:septal ring factor EnvC (AmiA/AmiB activator)